MGKEIRLTVGTPVVKHIGYPFPGEIRAAFTNRAGELRYVVEATGAGYLGMLHIFAPNQLVVTQGAEDGTRGASDA
jgi:hypothetical protein